jgi:hypothetical protein
MGDFLLTEGVARMLCPRVRGRCLILSHDGPVPRGSVPEPAASGQRRVVRVPAATRQAPPSLPPDACLEPLSPSLVERHVAAVSS